MEKPTHRRQEFRVRRETQNRKIYPSVIAFFPLVVSLSNHIVRVFKSARVLIFPQQLVLYSKHKEHSHPLQEYAILASG